MSEGGRAVISADFRLLAACAARPLAPERVRACAVGADTNALVGLADRHRISGIVSQGLRSAGVAEPPALAAKARSDAFAALRLVAETVRVDQRLRAAGVTSLTVKGAPLAKEAYGDPGLRHARDIDILIGRGDVRTAWRVLEADSYARLWPPGELDPTTLNAFLGRYKDSTLRHATSGVEIELHWRLSEMMDQDGPPDAAHIVEVALAGSSVRTLGPLFGFVYLCVHGSHHAWMRLKWLADIHALIGQTSDEGAAYWRFAKAFGADVSVEVAVRLAVTVFGLAHPPWLTAEPSLRVRTLHAAALKAMMADGDTRELYDRPVLMGVVTQLFHTFMHRDNRLRLRRARTLGFSFVDRVALPLPQPLHGLYPMLRLPLWAWRKLTGFQAFR